ncbi:hypothetical protein CONPUDRAFT_84044 [Coniophora puteana RWD-64-598 SS2]|uniref:Uncharacterized protein n=1 Tax=Coniophora puteana (strain RWD-64-598) TaxID=741705 RepID=A0A5M3MG66_CONPW|nr:uncharacterized protein CONPUDRAFT_84044 [Coniophora puteana RWD-64-598 SS2]EIW77591.1 hypothetical protein CONPUDRAFT_84044 [Coniophora puteana RWD-64-598 SS2]
MDWLKHENKAPNKRLKQVEDAGACVDTTEGEPSGDGGAVDAPRDDLVPRESWEVPDGEKKELYELVGRTSLSLSSHLPASEFSQPRAGLIAMRARLPSTL